MKIQLAIIAAGFILASGCDTPSEATGTTAAVTNSTDNGLVTTTTVTVPATTRTAFLTRYPTASNVRWNMYNETSIPIEWSLTDWPALDESDYVVTYTMDNNDYYSWYDSDGTWVGSTYMVRDYKSLPVAVSDMITSKYGGYTISSANLEYWKDRTAYQVELKNATTKVKMLVDPNGNIIKEKTKAL
jgi:hypothetical protein